MSEIKALAFDVFGTVVDWQGTIESEGKRLAGERAIDVNWEGFAVAWMRMYGKYVRMTPYWRPLDSMLVDAYYDLAEGHGLSKLTLDAAKELSTVWSRLRAWPDAVTGFAKLDPSYRLAAFSNANIAMLDSLAESSGLPWDQIISAERVKRYKPDPAVYQLAIESTGGNPAQVMLVAAHCFDLNAARSHGMKTALISRNGEPGSDPSGLDHQADFVVPDIESLATELLAWRKAE